MSWKRKRKGETLMEIARNGSWHVICESFREAGNREEKQHRRVRNFPACDLLCVERKASEGPFFFSAQICIRSCKHVGWDHKVGGYWEHWVSGMFQERMVQMGNWGTRQNKHQKSKSDLTPHLTRLDQKTELMSHLRKIFTPVEGRF